MHEEKKHKFWPSRVVVTRPVVGRSLQVLAPGALDFLAQLAEAFGTRIDELVLARKERQAEFDSGIRPDFLPQTQSIREGDWDVSPIPDALLQRKVEITGPVERKMIINALNSGADVFMADFEDSTSPTWENMISGQQNLIDAVKGDIEFVDNKKNATYKLKEKTAVLMVRPRGLHLLEKHFLFDNKPIAASLFDFGLYFYHNARKLADQELGPFFYLPKLESHLEARLWNDVFVFAQEIMGLDVGTIKATVLIETLVAAFEMDEILWELKEHSAGLNCGRWDYIFSFIKTFCQDPSFVLPDRALVSMEQPCMRAYTQLVVKTCHKRGVHAIGGMAAQIPIKHDHDANDRAIEKVQHDKLREVSDGHDGTWVAHPGLVPVAKAIFEHHFAAAHQIDKKRDDVKVGAKDLIEVPKGKITLEGLRQNIRIGIQYLAAWLDGKGCVPLYHLMEDAATAEISRAQVWQWLRHNVTLESGEIINVEFLRAVMSQEMDRICDEVGPEIFACGQYERARDLFLELSTDLTPTEFLTLPAYEILLARERAKLSDNAAGKNDQIVAPAHN